MSWKRAQTHAESMLENLGIGVKLRGKKDLRGKKVVFVDDGSNAYRTMCFTIAAKLAKKRGAEVETIAPGSGEAPHARVVEMTGQPKPNTQRPISRK
jgi:predicted GTPase